DGEVQDSRAINLTESVYEARHDMTPQHNTTDEEKLNVYRIATAMAASGLPASFVTRAVEIASFSEGAHDLMLLWEEFGDDPAAQEQVVADIQEAIDDSDESHSARRPTQKAKVVYGELRGISTDVLRFKERLREKVDRWGGISKLAAATGMPQPS